jgi:hypothetical protein
VTRLLLLLSLLGACSSGGPAAVDADVPDAALPPPPDLRFRAVGRPLTALRPIGGPGAMPGKHGDVFTFEHATFGFALTREDGFWFYELSTPGLPKHTTILTLEGADCPAKLDEAVARNSLILSLGGDAVTPDRPCIILEVGRPAGGPRYNYIYRGTSSPAGILQQLQADDSTRAMVVTAISAVGDAYTFVAEAVSGFPPVEQFETRIETPSLDEVAARAEALSADGFVITASTWTGGPYALVGTRPVGSTARYTAAVRDADPSGDTMTDLVAAGYAPVSFTSGPLPDGHYVWKVIAQKPR